MFLSQWSRGFIQLRGAHLAFDSLARDESSRFPCRHCCIFPLAAPRVFLTNCFRWIALSKFLDFSEILETDEMGNRKN
jgi:hypothetical protein